MKVLRLALTAILTGGVLLLSNVATAKSACQTKNWNHGTQQTMTAELPDGSTTEQIIISVRNLDDNEFQGSCPVSVPSPPTVGNYENRKCTPEKFNDMTTEWVKDKDEGDKHTVSIELKNGDQAPPRTVKLCVKYNE